jgi:hydroxyacyl-ACP dehydratase HTD2-like protein with hotdog domain
MSRWLEGKETKAVLQQAATETQTIMQQNANEARVIMQQAINNVEEVERSSPTGFFTFLFSKLSLVSQGS